MKNDKLMQEVDLEELQYELEYMQYLQALSYERMEDELV